jgi:hypothetical protein
MPYSGSLRRSLVPYSGEQVWGTGINPVHEFYGGPPDRLEPIQLPHGETVTPRDAVPQQYVSPELWGYTLDDERNTTVYYDARPQWNEQPEAYRGDSLNHPAWDDSRGTSELFRAQHEGAHRYDQKYADSLPNETVTEGWRNKPKGQKAVAEPSDPSQYEMQTSMRQRDQTRVNDAAVARSTDAPRESIASRIIGQKLKIFSGQMRHYDMLPKEQTQNIRPFSYRTAGTGRGWRMLPNAMFSQYPIQRTPPPEPSTGPLEEDLTQDYGYTPEDVVY